MTKLRSENHKQKDLIFVLSRQIESINKIKDQNKQQLELLNNTINALSSERTEDNNYISSIVQELNVTRLQSIY